MSKVEIIKIVDSELAFERAKTEIQNISNFEIAKKYHDKAEVLLKYYQKQHKERHDVQNKLAELKILAAHRAGRILKRMEKQGERAGKGQPLKEMLPKETFLSDLGVSRKQSHVWQKIAQLKKNELENYKQRILNDILELTEVGVYRFATKKEKLEDQDEVILPEGKYNTIIIDPAWPIDKIHRDSIPQGINLDYKKGRMSIEAIKEMDLPTADNCHLFLWTTQKYLPISFEILKAWEFKYIFTMVWHKAGGFQPFNLPQYNCEFAIYGRKGSPKFLETKNFFTCFNGKRREHSRKPVEFYDLIRRVCPEPRIDIFSREKIEGFDSFGDEIEKF